MLSTLDDVLLFYKHSMSLCVFQVFICRVLIGNYITFS